MTLIWLVADALALVGFAALVPGLVWAVGLEEAAVLDDEEEQR